MANGLLAKNGLIVTGSVEVQNAVTASTFSGDGSGLSGVSDFPYTGSAIISGSLEVTGSIVTTDNITIPRGKSLIFPNNPTQAGGISIGDNFSTSSPGTNFVRIGNSAGYEANANKFIAIGDEAGRSSSGQQQIFIGFRAGRGFDNSDNVVVIGHFAAWGDYSNADVDNAVILGTNAGQAVTQTDNIVIIGTNAGYNTEYSSKSVIIGDQAGYNHSGSSGDTKEGNVFLGYQAGYNELGSNKLIIANTGSEALVTGDFANNTFDISGSVSASTYYGDGSNLTSLPTQDPFPYTGDAIITGSNSNIDSASLAVANSDEEPLLSLTNNGTLTLGHNVANTTEGNLKLINRQGDSWMGGQNLWGNISSGILIQAEPTNTLYYRNLLFYVKSTQSSAAGVEKMRLDYSGNLGIGTTTPQERLHVAGNAVITGSNSLAGNYALKVTNTSGADILNVENDGNVGIGIDNPTEKLHVHDGIVHISDSSTNNYIDIEPDVSGVPRIRFFDAGAVDYRLTFASSRFSFNRGIEITNGHFELTSTDTILSDGKLQLRGTDTYVNFIDAGAAFRGAIGFLDNNADFIYTQGASTLAGGTEQFRIASSGNVGIGVTNPQTNLHVSSSVSASTYYGDGSNLTGIETDPFPYTGSAIISGGLDVTGDISASGDLSISGFPSVSSSLALATTNVFDYARAIMGSDVLQGGASQQDFNSATAQKVKFNTSADTEGTNITIDTTNNRITVGVTGYYQITSNLSFYSTSARTTPAATLKVNGTTDLLGEGYGYIRAASGQNDNNNLITCIVELQQNDYVEVFVGDTSAAGGALYATQAFFEVSAAGQGAQGVQGPTGTQGPSGTSYDVVEITGDTTLSSTYTTKYLVCNSSSPINLTIPASAAYDTYAEFVMEQRGTGTVTIVPAVGVTLNSSETLKTAKQYSVIGLKRTDTNIYTLTGERESTP